MASGSMRSIAVMHDMCSISPPSHVTCRFVRVLQHLWIWAWRAILDRLALLYAASCWHSPGHNERSRQMPHRWSMATTHSSRALVSAGPTEMHAYHESCSPVCTVLAC